MNCIFKNYPKQLSVTHLLNPKPNPFWMSMYFIPQKFQSMNIYSTSQYIKQVKLPLFIFFDGLLKLNF